MVLSWCRLANLWHGTFSLSSGQSERHFLGAGLTSSAAKKAHNTTDGSKLRTSSSWMALLYQAFSFEGENELQCKDLKSQCSGGK
jgi:hypothetical protein